MKDFEKDAPVASPLVARRTVVKGAAWSVPVIAAVVAVPAYASSHTGPVVELPLGDTITTWKGDHHYGSADDNPKQRAYDLPIVVKDASGNPIVGATVSIVVAGRNDDGDLIGIYTYPAPDNGGPESDPHRTASATTDVNGRALFAASTQNLTNSELREENTTATMTVTVTANGETTTKTITVIFTESD